jgi:hypothetical protein
MQRREKILLVILIAVIVLWRAIPVFKSVILQPLDVRRARATSLEDAISTKWDERIKVRKSRNQLATWNRQCLPPDSLDAQRLYQEWITDLALMSEFEDFNVTPRRRLERGGAMTRVRVTVEAKATFAQLCSFLLHFRRTDLLQQIRGLTVTDAGGNKPNGKLAFELTAEGLSLAGTAPRERLFPLTSLSADLDQAGTSLQVAAVDGFPEKPGFRVRIGKEYLTVTDLSEAGWTVTRAVDGTKAAEQKSGTTVEYAPLNAAAESQSYKDALEMLAQSPFMKPEPDKELVLTLDKIGEKKVFIGQKLEFTVKVPEVYRIKSKIKFALEKGAPEDAKIDESKGLFTWTVKDSVKAGDVECTFKVTDGAGDDRSATEKIKIKVEKDNAASTFFVASLQGASQPIAWLHERGEDKRTALRVGSTISVSDIKASVLEITKNSMLLESDGRKFQLALGGNLRSMSAQDPEADPQADAEKADAEKADAGANADTEKSAAKPE